MIYVTILSHKWISLDNYIVHDTSGLPQWVQERMAVLKLLEDFEKSPLGWWSFGSIKENILYYITTTKEEQEKWLKWRGKDLT